MRIRSVLAVVALAASTIVATATPVGAQQFECDDLPATIVGTNGNDVIRGTEGPDVIVALGGNDRIFGLGGGDTICGGPGNDRIKGQKGNDYIIGGSGNDIIFGNAGGDTIFGLTGKDILWGGVGPDTIHAGPGDDTIKAGHGNDVAIGGEGNDVIEGSTGADGLLGEAGADRLVGGKGFDTLLGGDGGDLLISGPGDDFVDGENGINRCRVDQRDEFLSCNRGGLVGEWGTGFEKFRVAVTPAFMLDSPGGPHYVMHVNAEPETGDRFQITVRNSNREIIFDGEFFGDTFHNVLVTGGTPAEVEILGAKDWNVAFVKETFPAKNIGQFNGNSDEVFKIFRTGQPQPTGVVVRNNGTRPERIVIMSIGDIGLTVELDATIEPGATETFSGDTRASAKYIAVYATKAVDWTWELDSFQGGGMLSS